MTPLPKRRHSTRRQGLRRASFIAKTLALSSCPACGKAKIPHMVCSFCGYYSEKVRVLAEMPAKKG